MIFHFGPWFQYKSQTPDQFSHDLKHLISLQTCRAQLSFKNQRPHQDHLPRICVGTLQLDLLMTQPCVGQMCNSCRTPRFSTRFHPSSCAARKIGRKYSEAQGPCSNAWNGCRTPTCEPGSPRSTAQSYRQSQPLFQPTMSGLAN